MTAGLVYTGYMSSSGSPPTTRDPALGLHQNHHRWGPSGHAGLYWWDRGQLELLVTGGAGDAVCVTLEDFTCKKIKKKIGCKEQI